ncbi:hypothetical protein GJ699_02265 [Duganella sp. FT80W]|uniref:Uncharacterized protein n=1 Tax=Duganella guangzhouensis TaxID=2666084 RepID=A0A6I2KSJ8_9BURK|nr:hypothetical protein [Duganella guangzhouensis]MRW88805.1 hypothetical protein [Duganella guangzhouensis]
MIARNKQPTTPEPTARDLAEKHERLLLRCRQECRQVLYQGAKQFIAGLHWHKGEAEAVVYLEGRAEPVKPAEITFIKEPE